MGELRGRVVVFVVVVGVVIGIAQEARAAVQVVPYRWATIQEAVDHAEPGDVIWVGPGRYCGATIDRPVDLIGGPWTTIIGCDAPVVFDDLRVGFFLPDAAASGTSIRGFRFDGAGISEEDLEPLAFGVLGRDAHGVTVALNRIDGTVQGITNTGGDGWSIIGNRITGLTLLPCPGRCGGGAGIVIQHRVLGERAAGNVVSLNLVEGALPAEHAAFDMAGVFVLGQEDAVVALNRVTIRDPDDAPAPGIGVLVSDVCCGLEEPFSTSIGSWIVGNDGRASEIAVQVDRDAAGGAGNLEGAVIFGNRGVNVLAGTIIVVP